jgi:hypothetical protein
MSSIRSIRLPDTAAGAAFNLSGSAFIFTLGNNTVGFLGAGSVAVSGGSLTTIFRY